MNNRIIKFRAWDTTNKKWLDRDLFTINPYNGQPKTKSGLGYEAIHETEVIVTQFTGLLDKNGKEIYEGDLMEFGEEKKWLGVIEWESETASFQCFDVQSRGTWQNWKWATKEVIGNVYENPDLIK